MTWKFVPIGSLGRVVTGRTPPSAEPECFGSGAPFLTPSDMSFDDRRVATERSISNVGCARFARTMLPGNAVSVVCIGATIGKICMTASPTLTNQQINSIVCDEAKADPYFVYYSLRLKRDELAAKAAGAATPIINKSAFEQVEIGLPQLDLQRRIASILSAYDDLIEVNTRRIAILEEMTRCLFDEWFVKFKFPGGDGSGPRWEHSTIESVIETLESGSRPKGGVGASGDVPSIGAENVLGLGQYDYGKEKFVSREYYRSMRRGHVRSGDVMLYKDGAYIGRLSMAWGDFPHSESVVNEHVFIVRPKSAMPSQYLFFWLNQAEMQQKIRGLNANAAQPGLNQPSVKGLPIMLPPKQLLRKFDELTRPLFDLLFNLAIQNPGLRSARNLLLPKLISGEIDLERAEHEVAREAAE